jgi:tRNA A37 threonylcarbamoyladenosine dehydratase
MHTQNTQKLEKALKNAQQYQDTKVSLSPVFANNVMREIRRMQITYTENWMDRVEGMLLPCASITGLATIVLLLFGFMTFSQIENEILTLISQDATGIVSIQLLGL